MYSVEWFLPSEVEVLRVVIDHVHNYNNSGVSPKHRLCL